MDLKQIIEEIRSAQAPNSMPLKVVAIDGGGGAGKSTLAARISALLESAPVIPTDDFASWENQFDWEDRFLDQVLRPVTRGEAARYQRYDWDIRSLAEWIDLPFARYLIIEGVGSNRLAFTPFIAYSIWVEADRSERLRRGLDRDGVHMKQQWQLWMNAEDNYFGHDMPRERSDVQVSGDSSPA